MKHGVLLTVAYDGANFCGWATQRDQRTVEDVMRAAIAVADPGAGLPRGASRTDSGVHAEGQLVAFDAHQDIPPRGWVLLLNQHLPDDCAVRSARAVPVGFNPRFQNKTKKYSYTLLLDKVRDPLLAGRSWRLGWDLDLEALVRESKAIEGSHDFAAFRSAGDARDDTRRTIHSVTVDRIDTDPRLLRITVEGSAFLYNMVRILVGTLVDVARGHLPEGTIAKALASKDRADAGLTAPPEGLVLRSIDVDFSALDIAGEPWPR